MKRSAYMPWTVVAVLALSALTLLPPQARAQTREALERREAALRVLEERVSRIREELARQSVPDQEAQAAYQQVLRELREAESARAQEARAQMRRVLEEHETQLRLTEEAARLKQAEALAQFREQEMEHRRASEAMEGERLARAMELQRELTVLSEEIEQERRLRSREVQERAQELALRVREFRARLPERVRNAQQVVLRARARARLGVTLDPTQGEEYDRQGARITGVSSDSPAEKAGLEEGDIITHVDGQSLLEPIPDEDDIEFGEDTSLPVQRLLALARGLEDGQEVEIRFLRDGVADSVTLEADDQAAGWVTVMPRTARGGVWSVEPEGRLRWRFDLPDRDLHMEFLPDLEDLEIEIPEIAFEDFRFDTLRGWSVFRGEGPAFRWYRGDSGGNLAFIRGGENFALGFAGSRLHGVEIRTLNPDLASYFSTDRGVLVLDVEEDSELGLQAGDVILAVGDREVEDTGDLFRILGSYEEGEAVTFTVMRHGTEIQVEGGME